MQWVVEYTDEFGIWWEELDNAEQVDVAAYVTMGMIPLADALYQTHLQELNKEIDDGG